MAEIQARARLRRTNGSQRLGARASAGGCEGESEGPCESSLSGARCCLKVGIILLTMLALASGGCKNYDAIYESSINAARDARASGDVERALAEYQKAR